MWGTWGGAGQHMRHHGVGGFSTWGTTLCQSSRGEGWVHLFTTG